MTPTDTIIALEKALEAIESFRDGKPSPPDFDLSTALQSLSARCTPRMLRTLLDAHASALRDAESLKALLARYIEQDIQTDNVENNLFRSARSALDDNTKGAAE